MNTTEPRPLIIVGAGGAGVEALWVCRRMAAQAPVAAYSILGFADDNPDRVGKVFEGCPIIGTPAQIAKEFAGGQTYFHCAMGQNQARKRLGEMLEAAGLIPAAIIDPSAIVADSARVGPGTFIGPQSVIAPYAQVGRHVLINSHVGVGHHAQVGDFAQLCPGVRVNGHCMIDKGALLGSNAVVHPGLTIGEGAIIGAGSFVIRSVKPRFSMLGVPARIVSRPADSGPAAQNQA